MTESDCASEGRMGGQRGDAEMTLNRPPRVPVICIISVSMSPSNSHASININVGVGTALAMRSVTPTTTALQSKSA